MDPNNPHERRPNSNLLAIPNDEPEEPRDTPFMRWAKFTSIIVVLAVVVGGFGAFTGFRKAYSQARYSSVADDTSNQEPHSIQRIKLRFAIGAIIGGVLGACYVGRCIARDEDP